MSTVVQAEEVPVSELKAHLADWLRKVEEGTELKLTRRGKVIATLQPPMAATHVETEEMDMVEYARWVREKFGGVKFAPEFDPEEPAVPAEEWNAVRGEID